MAAITYAFIFIQYMAVPLWLGFLQSLGILSVFFALICLQRIAVLLIAINFHQETYQDRIDGIKKASDALDHLRDAISVVALANVFDFPKKTIKYNEDGTEIVKKPFYAMYTSRGHPDKPDELGLVLPRKPSVRGDKIPHTASSSAAKPHKNNLFFPLYLSKGHPDQPDQIPGYPITQPENSIHHIPEDISIPISPPNDAEGDYIDSNTQALPASEILDSPIKGDKEERQPDVGNSIENLSQTADQKKAAEALAASTRSNLTAGISIGGPKVRKTDLLSDKNAWKLAEKIFKAVSAGQKQLIFKSFAPYFDSTDEATGAFELFDKEKLGYIDLPRLRQVITHIYRERRNLQQSLSDVSQALGRLNQILYAFSTAITLLFSMPILGITINAILPFTSLIFAMSFIFGGTAANTFECIIFLFVDHPFDAGDRINFDDDHYVVHEVQYC